MKTEKAEEMLYQMAEILIPKEYLVDFAITKIENKSDEWLIELREREERVPSELKDKDVVLDGYCDPVDVMTHAFSMKRIYLRLIRRKWKERGQTQHYSNTYDLHIVGAKITKTLAAFLKEFDR